MDIATHPASLYWLAPVDDFDEALARLREAPGDGVAALAALRSLAEKRLDFVQTRRLDRQLDRLADRLPPDVPRLKLAVISSSTVDHLVPGIRMGALRRGLMVDVLVCPFGQWRQQVLDPGSELYGFAPDAVLLSLEAAAIMPELPLDAGAAEVADAVDGVVNDLAGLWAILRDRARAAVIQQTPWSDGTPLYGHYERLVPASPGAIADRLDRRIAETASEKGVLLLDLNAAASDIGRRRISDRMLWHHAKQILSPAAVPWAGDQVARILAAIRGLSKKVLVLDLDNTLWGGTIGDDGLDGIVLGQGSGTGEAFSAFQRYVKRLAARGVVLAVSSKNDRVNAEAAFAQHPEMILRQDDFAAFEISWGDKPTAVRRVAEQLELGLDSFVFVDDNPVERDLMRQTLPQVAVPELPEAPELFPTCIADAGYFEAIAFTAEDSARNAQYVANRARHELRSGATDMDAFLDTLQTTMTVGPFQPTDVTRITQLINKTNQFNLTTRRYTEAEVRAFMEDPRVLTFAARVSDRFGDNGLTSIVICRPPQDGPVPEMEIDTWLMSCRILGRGVEDAMLSVVANQVRERGAERLVGKYRPTAKNGMVRELFPRLGFEPQSRDHKSGETSWVLPLAGAVNAAPGHLHVVDMR
ncbi:MAG: HAD family hydrolase [Rhodospirillales bacterium]|nr:HAD family hydrolase [Rhodospirillales bacterium]